MSSASRASLGKKILAEWSLPFPLTSVSCSPRYCDRSRPTRSEMCRPVLSSTRKTALSRRRLLIAALFELEQLLGGGAQAHDFGVREVFQGRLVSKQLVDAGAGI